MGDFILTVGHFILTVGHFILFFIKKYNETMNFPTKKDYGALWNHPRPHLLMYDE